MKVFAWDASTIEQLYTLTRTVFDKNGKTDQLMSVDMKSYMINCAKEGEGKLRITLLCPLVSFKKIYEMFAKYC